MINHNLLMYSLLDRKFSIEFNGKNWEVNYTEGDLFELNKKLLTSHTKYPIIWLQTGYEVKDYHKAGDRVDMMNCNFFLITKGDLTDRYKKRYQTNYQDMLFPLYERLKKAFKMSKGVHIMNDDISFVELPFNDVSELTAREGKKRSPENATVPDIWDAIVIRGINLRISAQCYPEFKI